MFRKTVWVVGIVVVLLLTGCGGSSGSGSENSKADNGTATDSVNSVEVEDLGEESQSSSEEDGESGSGSLNEEVGTGAEDAGGSERAINREMLVYTCNMQVDVLDFDKAVKAFKTSLLDAGGFVERENFSDSANAYDYYVKDASEKHLEYNATVRIPSSKYEGFTNEVSDLGDLRSKEASVDNLSIEYSDLETQKAIYQARYDRYMKMLTETQNESYALELEKQLTEVEVELARINNRMNAIETDVAYSYVNIRIREVKKYEEKLDGELNFFQRVGKWFKQSFKVFQNVFNVLVFLLIMVLPYLIMVGVVAAIVLYFVKRSKKKKQKQDSKK